MDPETDPELAAVAAAIERYLEVHPAAADSIEGVLGWWLADEELASLPRVVRALDWLIERNVVMTSTTGSGTVIYARRPGGGRPADQTG